MPDPSFENSVFLNCPFDREFEAIKQAILFAIVYLGFHPRIATERNNSAEVRLDKIVELIESSRYSIHDLSRCQAGRAGEIYRLNMPFELGIDYASGRFGRPELKSKRLLILEAEPYRYQQALSDISGFDIRAHRNDFERAIRHVRNWLVSEAGAPRDGAGRILGAYFGFQEWHYERQLELGFSDQDIQEYPTSELLDAMFEWQALGRPMTR